MTATAYSLDTNTILMAWNETYRPANFRGFWANLEELIRVGRAFISEEVERELSKKDDEAYAWVRERDAGFVVALEESQVLHARDLATDFPVLAKEKLGRMRADGFVIALALSNGLTVVTAENRRGPGKIPNICEAKGVPCCPLADVIAAEGWTFP